MAFNLLQLSHEHYSLEFDPKDMKLVTEVIQSNYENPQVKHYATCMSIKFSGCDFVYQNEWDDPCLISQCSSGAQILKTLYSQLKP